MLWLLQPAAHLEFPDLVSVLVLLQRPAFSVRALAAA
jgi:hypothetical protein